MTVGKLKKLGIGVGIVFLLFVVVVALAVASTESRDAELRAREDGLKNPPLSTREIKSMALDALAYDDLLRYNERYIGEIVHYSGNLLQVVHSYGDVYVLRIGVDGGFDAVYAHYAGPRVLEDDEVEFWGVVTGIKEYSALLGNPVMVPEMDILILERIDK